MNIGFLHTVIVISSAWTLGEVNPFGLYYFALHTNNIVICGRPRLRKYLGNMLLKIIAKAYVTYPIIYSSKVIFTNNDRSGVNGVFGRLSCYI